MGLMASAKQLAWRKKFAKMAKSGKFRKKKTSTKNPYPKSHPRYEDAKKHPHKYGKHQDAHVAEFDVTSKKRMTRNELEQKELENLNRNIPQFEMVNMGKQSQKILDSMKKRRDILSKKY